MTPTDMTTPDNKPAEIPKHVYAKYIEYGACKGREEEFFHANIGYGESVVILKIEDFVAVTGALHAANAQIAALEECNRGLREAIGLCDFSFGRAQSQEVHDRLDAALAQTPASVSSAFAELKRENFSLRASMAQRVDDYLNERVCCSGTDCGCMGASRFEEAVWSRKNHEDSEDTKRLDWLCDYITENGLNGFEAISWTVYDEDGKSLMRRDTITKDEVGDVRFDRAAIDAARAQPAQPQGGTEVGT